MGDSTLKGRDAKIGQFIPVKDARQRPNTTTRPRGARVLHGRYYGLHAPGSGHALDGAAVRRAARWGTGREREDGC